MPHKRYTKVHVQEDGTLRNGQRLMDWLVDQFSLFADGPAVITIQRPKRSLDQNRYYFGVVLETIRQGLLDAGHTFAVEDLHEHFKGRYLGGKSITYRNPETGNVREKVVPRSTTELDTTAFHDYIERIKTDELVRQLDIRIPSPDEVPIEAYA